MRKLFSIFILVSFCNTLQAQEKILFAEGSIPNLYISHTIEPKENYYSVGRLYNVSPKELAPYNNLVFEKGFTLGQTIKIPIAQNNFTQGEAPKENEVLIPVYHITQPKEGLYRVSKNYKITLDQLRQWNKLNGDAISNGTKLIIGYLKVLKDQSPLASQAVKPTEQFAAKKPEEKKIKIKEKEKINEPKKVTDNKEKIIENKEARPEVVEKPAELPPVKNNPINFNGGKFKSLYNDQTKNRSLQNENGPAAIFKTTSGWQDGKYYCFHSTAEPGTIIKVTNNANGKSIYAKVLDAIPDIKQNSGLLLRISNAAADELGVTDARFDCSISYVK